MAGCASKDSIDRIDADPQRRWALVIDYKSGNTTYGPAFSEESALQIPLYVLALQRLWPDTQVIGGLCAALGSGVWRGMVLAGAGGVVGWVPAGSQVDEDRYVAELESCRSEAVQAVEGIRAGRIGRDPSTQCPPFCELGPVCRSRPRGSRAHGRSG